MRPDTLQGLPLIPPAPTGTVAATVAGSSITLSRTTGANRIDSSSEPFGMMPGFSGAGFIGAHDRRHGPVGGKFAGPVDPGGDVRYEGFWEGVGKTGKTLQRIAGEG